MCSYLWNKVSEDTQAPTNTHTDTRRRPAQTQRHPQERAHTVKTSFSLQLYSVITTNATFEYLFFKSVLNKWPVTLIIIAKIPILGLILSSRGPPRKHFGLPAEMLWWIPQVKSCPCARKAKPIHAPNPVFAPFSIIFPPFLPFHSQSLTTSVLRCPQPPCLPSSDVEYQRCREETSIFG